MSTGSSLSSSSKNLSLPEEILEYIISFALFSDASDDCSSNSSALSVLLVCKAFDRIAKPLLYSSLHLRTREQSDKLAEILSIQPTLCAYIRAIRVDAPSASQAFLVAADILSKSNGASYRVLDMLDVRLVDERRLRSGCISTRRKDLEALNTALRTCPDTRCLIMRQDGYLTSNTIISFTEALASGVKRWQSLEFVDLRTRPVPLPSTPGRPKPDPLASALANAPSLRVLRARQPTLVNSFLLDVAQNAVLERIELIQTATGIPESNPLLLPFVRLAFAHFDRHQNHSSTLTAARMPAPRQPPEDQLCSRRTYRSGDVGTDTGVFEAATAELETQQVTEPQSLFASQVGEHPHLEALIRAGRLQLIIERLLMARNERCFGGDRSKEQKRFGSANGMRPCVCPGMERGLPGPACDGCPARRASF